MVRSRLVREGSVGLFFLLGVLLFSGVIIFLKGSNLQNQNYQIKLLFANAGGLREGAKVYYRGVAVGRITGIQPSSNGVEVATEIDGNLRIPKNVKISTLRSGLLGEVSVNVIPQKELLESAKEIDPLDEQCKQQQQIICDNQKVKAKSTPDLVESLSNLTERIDNDEFFTMLNETLVNVNETTEKMIVLTDEVTAAVQELRGDFQTFVSTTEKIGSAADSFTVTADSLSETADTASQQIEELGSSYSDTARELNVLASNLNLLIDENKTNFQDTIANFSQAAGEISQLVNSTEKLIAELNPEDVAQISQNLNQTSQNIANISQDLQGISSELSNPTNLATLQQTLDSARVTFANTAKITSDIDEFTGDPEFRSNLRKLIDGLGNLVSYTDILEQQIELAKVLEDIETVTTKENSLISIDRSQSLNIDSPKFPTVLSNTSKTKNPN